MANYEARLRQESSISPVLNAVASASVPCGAEHSQMVNPGADSASNPLRIGEAVTPWTRHEERAHRLSAHPEQSSLGGHYMGESIPHVSPRSVPRYDKTSDDDNYQPGFHAQSYYDTHEPGLAHPDTTRGCQEWLSRRDWYEAPNRPAPAPLPRHGELGIPQQPIVDRGPAPLPRHGELGIPQQPIVDRGPAPLPRHGELGIPQQPIVDRGPVRPYPQVRLAQMHDFQGDGSVTLNMFSDQVDELSRFYHWDEQETCHQARAHLRGTTHAYVRVVGRT